MTFDQKPICKKFDEFKKFQPKAKRIPRWAWNGCSCLMKYSGTSSGAVAAFYYTSLNKSIMIYGFDFFNADRHHYGDDMVLGKIHGNSFELNYFKKLVEWKRVYDFCNYFLLVPHLREII